ncbi:MAG: hypothetical protein HYY25_09005 [Candidatus Wallbacteria bacterium]|nr:hypothetical protein [Candidatus Wallbacteria bacterium]
MKRIGLVIAALALGLSMVRAETDYIASGYQYIDQGDLARAERMFKAAIKINVDDDAAWDGLKKVHALQAKKSGAAAAPAGKRKKGKRLPPPPADDTPNLSLSEPTEAPPEPQAALEPPAPAEEPPADGQVEEINKKLLTKYLGGGRSSGDEEAPAQAGPAKKPAKGKAKSRPKAASDESSEGEASAASSDSEAPKAVQEPIDDKIDQDLLRNLKRATESFNKLRDWATTQWRRESNGATQFIPTYYSPQLYKLLVTKLGAQKNWSVADTQKKYRRLMTDNSGVLEFYVKLINTTRKPKTAVPVADICDRTFLEDDNGNSYKPMRFKAPSVTKLLDEDSYTVWFPKFDADGNSVVDKAREKLFLVINDQEQEPATVRIAFTKKQFDAKTGKKSDDKPWWKIF